MDVRPTERTHFIKFPSLVASAIFGLEVRGNLEREPKATNLDNLDRLVGRLWRSAERVGARVKQKRDEGSRQAGKRQFRLVAVRGMPYATSGLNRGMARHSLTLGLARLNREPRLRGGYG